MSNSEKKPLLIMDLERRIGRSLNAVSAKEIINWRNNGYTQDASGHVTGLNLDSMKLADISFLRDFKQLFNLSLFENCLSNISPLREFASLKRLDLGGNNISDVSPLQELTSLTRLDLGDNQLHDVSPLQGLLSLTALGLSRNHLSDVSPLQELTFLRELNLYDNKLSDISPLQYLTSLEKLWLSENQITDVSPLQGITSLTKLHLNNNLLFDMSPLLGLTALTCLDLRYNKITHLPRRLLDRIGEKGSLVIRMKYDDDKGGIFLEENPLESPPVEIVKRGTNAMRNYVRELWQHDHVHLLNAKILIVGNGEVGKTTLMKKLQNPKYILLPGREETTHGININSWELECNFPNGDVDTVKLSFWDFGGQDIYHATHQFFLTKRSLYLFVWEARKEDESRSFSYWLNIIKLLGTLDSPVIVVMNKADIRVKQIDEAQFLNQFPNIKAFHQVSCLNTMGIAELTEAIRCNLSLMPHLKDLVPFVWQQIREKLQKLPNDYIHLSRYITICREFGLDRKRALFLSEYLHDLGVILHFRHDPLLENIVILKPEWATGALYTLLDTRQIQQNNGCFQYQDLGRFWEPHQYPLELHPQLVRLMEKFELCFSIPGSHLHFAPELLPAQRPNEVEIASYTYPKALWFQYHYEFMPEGIISRFIARCYFLIHGKHFWKNGVELRLEKASALVLSEPLRNRIRISVYGDDRTQLLSIIRSQLGEIHQTLNMEPNIHYYQKIPCNCDLCSSIEEPHLYDYHVLIRRLSKNIQIIPCLKSDDDLNISTLLMGIDPETMKRHPLKMLIQAARLLQRQKQTIHSDEESRNSLITLQLSITGLRLKNQALWSVSSGSRRPGELVFITEGDTQKEIDAVVEAFNLKNMDRTVIKNHLTKLLSYPPDDSPSHFILAYAEANDFQELWGEYFENLKEVDFGFSILIEPPSEVNSGFEEIKLARTRHRRQDGETEVFHLFINMKD